MTPSLGSYLSGSHLCKGWRRLHHHLDLKLPHGMGLLRRHQLVSMFQQYLTDTLKNTDRKKNFPTKQADTISKRNKQTNLSNKTALSAGNNQNFPSRTRFRSAGDVSLYARDGKMLGSHRNPSMSYIGIPQNRTKL